MSGVTVTYSHRALLVRNKNLATDGLIWTLIFGVAFILSQLSEYNYSHFSMNDGIYGSVFYILTGFHGLHVIIGCTFLAVALYRLVNFHFTDTHHVGYEVSVLYWHMVDIVWLFLFLFVYLWGSGEYDVTILFDSFNVDEIDADVDVINTDVDGINTDVDDININFENKVTVKEEISIEEYVMVI